MNFMKIVHFFERSIFTLNRTMGIVGIVMLVIMMLFTVLDVFLRAFFNNPIPGDVELIEMLMVCVGFLGLAWCAMRGMHIKVDLLVSFLPKRTQSVLDSFCYVIAFCICAVVVRQSIVEGFANREMNNLSPTLEIPVYPLYWVLAFGYAILCLALLVLLARSIKETVQG
jgi:TRAP-type C4-dicarboxylate transport system permease small subunit